MSGAAGTFVPIPAPLATAPRVGLLTAAVFPDGVDGRWVNGFGFRPDPCRPGGGNYWCGESPSTPPDPDPLPDVVQHRPTVVEVVGECSTLGAADVEAQARRSLAAAESRLIEAEFWTGTQAQAAGFPNRYLRSADTNDLGTVAGFYALAALQQYAADEFDGRAMIHARPTVVEFWQRNGELRREGNLILDVFDNVIVPGSGYDGLGPVGATAATLGEAEYAYVTPMVYVLRDSTVTVTPDRAAAAVDPSTNLATYRAQRIVAPYWGGCEAAAVLVDLAAPCWPA